MHGYGISVSNSVQGESANMVEKENAGVLFEPENADELVSKLFILKNDKKQYLTIKKCCSSGAVKYDRSVLANKMLDYQSKSSKKVQF